MKQAYTFKENFQIYRYMYSLFFSSNPGFILQNTIVFGISYSRPRVLSILCSKVVQYTVSNNNVVTKRPWPMELL